MRTANNLALTISLILCLWLPSAMSGQDAVVDGQTARSQGEPEAPEEELTEDTSASNYTYYERPSAAPSPFRAINPRMLDILVFCGLLAMGAWASTRKNRIWTISTLVASLIYLGFVRGGCVCAVGSVGVVVRAAVNSRHILPFDALAFFFLPLMLALAMGRVFCGTVCPIGAIQELLAWRPIRVPKRIDQILSFGPLMTLCWVVAAAALWAELSICRLDPFVPVFHMKAHAWAFAAAGAALLLSVFVTRFFCRYICPYGALLGLVSLLAWKPRRIDDQACLQCGACSTCCPTGAAEKQSRNSSSCVVCGRCADKCPTDAVR